MRYPLALLVCASVLVATGRAALPENHRPSHRPPRTRHIPSRTQVRTTSTTTTTTEEPVVSSTTATPSTIAAPTDLVSTTIATDPERGTFDSQTVDAAQISSQILAQQHQQQLALEAMKVAVQTIQTTIPPPYVTTPSQTQFQAASTLDIQQLIQMMQKGQYGNDGQFSFSGPSHYNPAAGFNSLQYQQPNAQQSFVPDGAYQAQASYGQTFQPHIPLQQFMQQHPILPYGAPLPYNPPETPTYVFRDGKYHVQAPGIEPNRGARTPLAINDTPLTVEASLDLPPHALPYLQPGQTIPSPMQAQQAFAKLAQEQVQQALTFSQAQAGPPLPYIQPVSPTQQHTSGFAATSTKQDSLPAQPSQAKETTQEPNSKHDSSSTQQGHSQAAESQQVFSQPAEQQIEQQPLKPKPFSLPSHQQSAQHVSYPTPPQQQQQQQQHITYSQPLPQQQQQQVYIQPSQQTQQQLYSQQQIYTQVPSAPQQQIIYGHPHQQQQQEVTYSHQQSQVPQQQIPHQQQSYDQTIQTRIVVPEPSATLKAPAPSSFSPSRLISYQSYVAHPTSQTEHNPQPLPHSEQVTHQVVLEKSGDKVTEEQILQQLPVDYEKHPKSHQKIKSPFRTAPQYSEEVVQQEIETKKATTNNKSKVARPSFLSQLFRGRS